MAPKNLYDELSSRYEVLDFVDLALVCKDPSLGFKVINQYHRDYYSPRQRIVFYTGFCIGEKTLQYLRYAADQFDVSRCFVLVCCANQNIEIKKDDIELLSVSVDSDEFDENKIISVNSLCCMPWFHMEVLNQSGFKVCCYSQHVIKPLQSPEDLLLFDKDTQRLREQLLNGEYPENCKVCWERENKGMDSLRQWRNKTHKKEFLTEYINKPQLKSLVLRPTTVCNFKCRICSETASSQIANENLVFAKTKEDKQKTKQIIKESQWFEKNQTLQQQISDLWPRLEFIDIYGGEPLLIKQFKKWIGQSIVTGACKKQRLHFNTNGSLFPEDLVMMMRQFKSVAVSLSIDDIGDRFELARGGKWQEVEQNVKKWLACDPEIFQVSSLTTISNLNVLYLDELIDWANRENLPLTFNMLTHPKYLKFDQISEKLRRLIIDKYQSHQHPTLKAIVEALQTSKPVDEILWIDNMRHYDSIRNQDISISHPDLASAMNYTKS